MKPMEVINDKGEAKRVYDEVLGTVERLAKAGVENGLIANVLFALGVRGMLRLGDTIEEIKTAVVEVANLDKQGRA